MTSTTPLEQRVAAMSAPKRALLANRLAMGSGDGSASPPGGRTSLAAFVTTASQDSAGAEPGADELRAHLEELLPHYMVPTDFRVLDEFPRLPNGKVDVAALREIPAASTLEEVAWIEPRGPIEQALASIWCEALQLDSVSVRDNFFELGGDSLLAMHLVSRIKQQLGVSPHLNTLWFGAETIEDQAQVIADLEAGERSARIVMMRAGGGGTPLFCIHTIGGGNLFHYSLLVEKLAGECPVYGLQARGVDGVDRPDHSVEAMAAYCIESLLTVQPEGPYLLCGFSSGGVIAYEMAQQLTKQNYCQVKLMLIDTYFPRHPESFSEVMSKWLELVRNRKYRDIQERVYYTVLGMLGLRRYRRLRGMGESHRWALWSYIPKPYAGQAVYIEAEDGAHLKIPQHAPWSNCVQGGMEILKIPGSHGHMVHEPHVAELARCLDEIMRVPTNK